MGGWDYDEAAWRQLFATLSRAGGVEMASPFPPASCPEKAFLEMQSLARRNAMDRWMQLWFQAVLNFSPTSDLHTILSPASHNSSPPA